jgi:CRISPR-associated protein Csm2
MEFKTEWISKQLDPDAIKWAEHMGKQYNTVITTSQIRKFFGALRGLELKADQNQVQLLLLKPKLAYAIARIKKNLNPRFDEDKIKSLDKFFKDFSQALDTVKSTDRNTLNNFISLFEAFVAYHKYHGGKD